MDHQHSTWAKIKGLRTGRGESKADGVKAHQDQARKFEEHIIALLGFYTKGELKFLTMDELISLDLTINKVRIELDAIFQEVESLMINELRRESVIRNHTPLGIVALSCPRWPSQDKAGGGHHQ